MRVLGTFFLFIATIIATSMAAPILNAQVTFPSDTEDDFDLYSFATETRVDLDFEGGTVESFVEQITEALPPLNVVVRPEARPAKVPEVHLRNVSAYSALSSLFELTSERVISEDGEDYFTVMLNPEKGANTVAVLSVGSYIMGDSGVDAAAVERLMSAIEEGGKLLTMNSDSMKIRMHEETALLFVTGNAEEIRLVTQIVEQLTGHASSGIGHSPFNAGARGFPGQDPR